MLSKNLNKEIFEKNVKTKPLRDGFGEGLLLAGEENENVVCLCADLMESTRMDSFAAKFPERFFECGVAEQNMAGIAAGLGISGKIPFISSYATFSPGRNWEQIRTTIAYSDSNVKIAGHHAGVSTGPDGATHQATEDIAMMRVLPNMKIIVPCDAIEAKKATVAASKLWGPIYLRFSRNESPIITLEESNFTPGKAQIFWQSKNPKVAILGCGPILYKCILAAKKLEKEKIETLVLNVHTIKPLDEKKIVEVAKKCGAFAVVEEHQIKGGLGGAISEVVSKFFPVPVEFIGMRDVFGESGEPEELIKKYNIDTNDIVDGVKNVIKRKNCVFHEKTFKNW